MASRRTDSRIEALVAGPETRALDVEIPYRKYVLSNGLTLLVHEDR